MLRNSGYLLACALLLAGCSEEEPPPALVEVIVDEVVNEPYQPKASFVGRLHAQADVAIQAKVAGYMTSRNFLEGRFVKAGDLLYEIDPAEFEAEMARARADLARAKANQAVANRNYKRGEELLPAGNISASEMDQLTGNKLEADAGVESAKAQIKTVEVNLSYTRILAPISGRIGRSEFSPGDLIGPTTGPLTTLVSVDPIQALFQLAETTFVSITLGDLLGRDGQNTQNLDSIDTSDIEVSLELSNRQLYPLVGRVDYFANRISEDTGTLEARALIPNPHGLLVPGQYVRVIVERTNLVEALFIPQAAVQADQQGNFVLVVQAGTVQRRNVILDERVDENVIVQQGLEVGEVVIVRGLQQVRPGQAVTTRAMPKEPQA